MFGSAVRKSDSEYEIRAAGSTTDTFQEWMLARTDEEVAAWFGGLSQELDVARGLESEE